MKRAAITQLCAIILALPLCWPTLTAAKQGTPPDEAIDYDEPIMTISTLLHDTKNYSVHRQSRHLIVSLKQAHRIISTSDINGGEQTSMRHIVNFQSMEGNNHQQRFEEILNLSPQEYHQQLADALKLPADTLVSMGTAVSITNAVHVQKSFRDITVDAFATAGVHSNALRAGDPAKWYQGKNGNEFVGDVDKSRAANEVLTPNKDAGTINLIILVNRTMTPGSLVKAAAVITEAKSAALNALAIPSTQSNHLATGTGTDQYAIAAPLNSSLPTLDSASGHLKLGQLLGAAVFESVSQAIELQDGLNPNATRNIVHALNRYGATEELLLNQLKVRLNEEHFQLLRSNARAIFSEAKLVAAAYAYSALLDRLHYGTLSNAVRNDVLLDQAVNTALAVSGKSQHWSQFRTQLKVVNDDPLDLFLHAVAIGWEAKWKP